MTPKTPEEVAEEIWLSQSKYQMFRGGASWRAHVASLLRSWQTSQGEEREALMLRSVLAMGIAEGDDGWRHAKADCPMLLAVYKLRTDYEILANGAVGKEKQP